MATSGEGVTHDEMAALALQLDDARGELVEELKQQFGALMTFLQHPPESPTVGLLEEVIALLRPPVVMRPWWHAYCWPAGAVLSGLVGCGFGWWLWGASVNQQAWATLGQRLDTVVVEHYMGLSVPAQQAMNGLYRQLGIATPGDRKGR